MTIREIEEIIEEGNSLKSLAQSFGEIAIMKIRKIRDRVERNRRFYHEISSIFKIVEYQAQLKKVTLPKPKQTVSLVLTSNSHFYGSIDNRVMQLFLSTIRQIQTDIIIVGQTGETYIKSQKFNNPKQVIIFKQDSPDPAELDNLTKIIRDYQKVLIFYPQFSSLLVQNPKMDDLGTLSQSIPTEITKQPYVIFEPEIQKILRFFDSSIINLLLEQTFFESELARTASRIMAMDEAQSSANDFIKREEYVKGEILRDISNNRMLETFISLLAIKNYEQKSNK